MLVGAFAPSPDGASVVFIYRTENTRNGQYHAEVAVADVATGVKRDLTKNEAPEGDVRWSPDGRTISFTAPSDKTWELAQDKLWTVPAAGGAETDISGRFGGDIRDYYWSPDGRSIYFAGVERGRSGFYRLDVAGGAVRTLATGDWSANLDSVTRDLSHGAAVVSTPSAPGDVAVVDLATGERRTITELNPQIKALALATCKAVTWKSQDGTSIEGLLWLPALYHGGAAAAAAERARRAGRRVVHLVPRHQ